MALAEALEAVLTRSNLARRLGEEAHFSAAEHTWDRVAIELVTAYEAAIHYRARRGGFTS
jgi:hypothetical protein